LGEDGPKDRTILRPEGPEMDVLAVEDRLARGHERLTIAPPRSEPRERPHR
jgi:hypothetical protein